MRYLDWQSPAPLGPEVSASVWVRYLDSVADAAFNTGSRRLYVGQLTLFARAPSPSVRVYAASHPHTPVAALRRCVRDPAATVRCAVAGNPNTPQRSLRRLARDPDVEVRAEVAGNPNAPAGLSAPLIVAAARTGRFAAFQRAAAHWPAVTAEAIAVLAATHPETTDVELIALAEATTGEIRPTPRRRWWQRRRT